MQTTVVGSYPKIPNLPRPARLRQAIARHERGQLSVNELAEIEGEVTAEVIKEQIEAGIDIVSDGQIRWDDDQTYLMRHWQGVEIGGLQRYLDTNTYFREPEIKGPLAAGEPVLGKDYRFAAARCARPIKAIVPGPYTLAALSKDEHYGNRRDLTLAIAELLTPEVADLEQAGAPIIQINEPLILRHPGDISVLREALARMLSGVSAETALYTWFGTITPELLDLPVDTIGVDLVSKPGNWNVLRQARPQKKIGLGIIDGRNTRLESSEEIAASVRRALEFCDPDSAYVNPSCGLEYLPREVAFEKLRRLVAGARLAQSKD